MPETYYFLVLAGNPLNIKRRAAAKRWTRQNNGTITPLHVELDGREFRAVNATFCTFVHSLTCPDAEGIGCSSLRKSVLFRIKYVGEETARSSIAVQ